MFGLEEIPDAIFAQMKSCQMAANEFLRQFWSAVCPNPSETTALVAPTPAQRTAKAAKMAGYLANTYEKVDAIARAAQAENVEPKRVQIVSRTVGYLCVPDVYDLPGYEIGDRCC